MTTHFIELEIPLEPPLTVAQIEAELSQRGEPLRWAITQIDREQSKAVIEAVVTSSSGSNYERDGTIPYLDTKFCG